MQITKEESNQIYAMLNWAESQESMGFAVICHHGKWTITASYDNSEMVEGSGETLTDAVEAWTKFFNAIELTKEEMK